MRLPGSNTKLDNNMTKQKVIKAPKHLKPDTGKWFKSVIKDYELEPHHIRLLTLAGEAWDRCQEAREIVDKEGLTAKDRFGQLRQHPAISIERDCRIAFARLLRELNLDVESPETPRPNQIKH